MRRRRRLWSQAPSWASVVAGLIRGVRDFPCDLSRWNTYSRGPRRKQPAVGSRCHSLPQLVFCNYSPGAIQRIHPCCASNQMPRRAQPRSLTPLIPPYCPAWRFSLRLWSLSKVLRHVLFIRGQLPMPYRQLLKARERPQHAGLHTYVVCS